VWSPVFRGSASPSPMASTDSALADVIQRVFRVTLVDPGPSGSGERGSWSDLFYLESLAMELVTEGQEPPFVVTPVLLERALFARLNTASGDFPAEWQHDPELAPFPWLLASYNRCDVETRKTRSRDMAFATATSETLGNCFDMCVSYSGLVLNPATQGMFPQPAQNEQRGALQLFDALAGTGSFAELTNQWGGSLPNGFLNHFGDTLQNEGLSEILTPVLAQLPLMIKRLSPLGDTHNPLNVLVSIAMSKPCALVLASHPNWKPNGAENDARKTDGRAFEQNSIVGPFFRCAALPDDPPVVVGPNGIPMRMPLGQGNVEQAPDIRHALFTGLDKKRQNDLDGAHAAIRTNCALVREGLFQTMYALLRHGGEAREAVVGWLAMWCDENVGRSKMRIDATKTASHGGAVNVSSIAARLAAPFCDPGSLKYRKINPDYTRSKKCRLDVRETTRISASDAQVVSGALTETEEVRVARFPNPAFLFYLSAGDCLSIHRLTRD
jgi:hypothetical protein